MPFRMGSTRQILTYASIAFTFCGLAQSQSCYYPDGSIAINDTPCSSAAGTVCCGYGFACLENGVCQVTTIAQKADPSMNGDISYFRGSCTDQTWASADCPHFCIGTQYADGGGNSMEYCSSDTYCCYGGTCDCSTNFNTTVFSKSSVAYTTIGVAGSGTTATSSSSFFTSTTSTATSSAAITAASTSAGESGASSASSAAASAAASSSATPTASPSGGGGLSTGAKAGIGVGVALGVIALIAIGLLILRSNRQRKELESMRAQREPLQPSQPPMEDANQHQHQPTMQDHNRYQQPPKTGPSELSGQSPTPAWSQQGSPEKGYYHSGTHSTSTPSNPSEMHG